jgi:hypothetical protein
MWNELVCGDEDDPLVGVAGIMMGLFFREEAGEAGKATASAPAAAEPQASEGEEAEYNNQDDDSGR